MSSANSKGVGWMGRTKDFVQQLVELGLKQYLDDEADFDIFVGKGGSRCSFYHHYIVLASSLLSSPLIFELAKSHDAAGTRIVVPSVREFSGDSEPEYKITITTTLRLLAELASKVILLLGPYNLITASCQTFSDEFLKQLGSGGYMTYLKTATTVAAVAGVVAAGAGLLCWLTSGDKKDKK